MSSGSLLGRGDISLFDPCLNIGVSYEFLGPPLLLKIIDPGLLLGKQPLGILQLGPLLLHFSLMTLDSLQHPLQFRRLGR